jgi:hypothetical protein
MPTHLSWVVFIGLPIFAIWVLGVPLVIYITLRRRQDNLDSEHNLRALGFWYIGLKRRSKKEDDDFLDIPHENNAYYWELLMELRKTTLITINTISSAIHLFYRALLMLLILYFTCLLVTKVQPYRTRSKVTLNTSESNSPKAQQPQKFTPNLNKLHYLADLTALITFAIAISLEVVSSPYLKYSFFVVMVVVNMVFLIVFVYNYTKYVMTDFLEKRRKKREERERQRQIEEFKKQEEYKVRCLIIALVFDYFKNKLPFELRSFCSFYYLTSAKAWNGRKNSV